MKRNFAVLLVFVMILGFTAPAFADNVIIDGDGLVPVNANVLNFGSVEAGSSKTATVLLAISRQGNAGSPNVFKDETIANITLDKISDSRLSVVMDDSSISIPGGWGSQKNNVITADTASSQVTLTIPAGTAAGGPYSATIEYLAVGEDAKGSCTRTGTLTVNYSITAPAKIPLTITANAKSKVYGVTDPILDYTVSGLAAGDTLSGSLTRAAGEDVGTYAIGQGTLSAGSKYNITFVGAYLTITKAQLTVTAENQTKTYGDENPLLTYSITGLKNGDVITGEPELSCSATATTPVSESPVEITIDQGTLSASNNYSFYMVNGSLTITKALLTVTADSQTRVYGNENPELTYSITGFKNGETEGDVVTGEPALSCSATAATPVSASPVDITVDQGTLSADNYSFDIVNGSLTINPRPISVTADSKTKEYGNADPALTWKITSGSLVNGDTLNGNLSRVSGESVGTYAIQQGDLSASDNYSMTFVDGILTINQRKITVTADPKTKEFGSADPALTWKITSGSLVNGDSINGNLSRMPGELAGTYDILQGTLSAGNNYSINFVGSKLTINPYTFSGFRQPIDNKAVNNAKAGSSIPVKFSLNGYKGMNIFYNGYPISAVKPDGLKYDDIKQTVTAGASTLSYDAKEDQYTYVWKTDKSWTGLRELTVKFADGKSYTATFQFK